MFPPRRVPTVNYNWSEFLEGNGIITFYGSLQPGKTTKYEYFEGPRDSTKAHGMDTIWTAQTFAIGTLGANEAFYPTKIWIDLPTDTSAYLAIEETTAGEPNGTRVATFYSAGKTIISTNGSNPEWYEFDITDSDTPNIKLSASTTYALVIYREGGAIALGFDSSGTYAGGAKYDSVNSGGTWTEDSGADVLFAIRGSTKNPFILTTANVTSSRGSTAGRATANATQLTELLNVSFEGKINKSAIIDGDAIVNFTTAEGSNIETTQVLLELYHVSGATETKIGEAESWINPTASGVEMELTRTTVKSGDKIKLKFILYYTESAYDQNTTFSLSHSGANLALHLPFKTDL